jgi:hypothetical protein
MLKPALQIFPNEFELFEFFFTIFSGFQLPHGDPFGFDISLLFQIVEFMPWDI